jgi:hypothetical protein
LPAIEIKHADEHYELFVDGKFFCSGDTISECIKEYHDSLKDK